MRHWLQLCLGLLAVATLTGSAQAAGKPSPFASWAAVVVAGDFHAAHADLETEAFDNARRDVTLALSNELGIQPGNIRQFSVRPERYPDTKPGASRLFTIYDGLKEVAGQAKAGCLVYFTSHGTEYGAFLNNEDDEKQTIIFPATFAEMIDRACPGRPAIVIVSTCFSGVNVPAMSRQNWMVMTAARKDRSSFGCSENDTYPFFDDCFLSSVKIAKDFPALATAVKACVAQKELEQNLSPASEPQVWIGGGLKPMLPLMAFPHG